MTASAAPRDACMRAEQPGGQAARHADAFSRLPLPPSLPSCQVEEVARHDAILRAPGKEGTFNGDDAPFLTMTRR